MTLRIRIVAAFAMFLVLILGMGSVAYVNLKRISGDVVALHMKLRQMPGLEEGHS